MDEQLRVLPVRRSLIRPNLLVGCDRRLLIGLCTLSIIFVFSLGFASSNYLMVLIGLIIFFAGRKGLATLAKREPCALDIFKASVKYHRLYLAKSGGKKTDKYLSQRFI